MRSIAIITAPDPILVAADAKLQPAINGSADDGYLEMLIDAATQSLDGPNGWLGRALAEQVLELRMDQFPPAFGFGHNYGQRWAETWCVFGPENQIRLPLPPLVSVDSIKYDDPAGDEQTLDPATYRVTGIGTDQGMISLQQGQCWPLTKYQAEAVRIRYTAGYGIGTDVPAPIRQAILLGVTQLYGIAERNLFISEDSVDGVNTKRFIVTDNAAGIVQKAVDNLLANFRVY